MGEVLSQRNFFTISVYKRGLVVQLPLLGALQGWVTCELGFRSHAGSISNPMTFIRTHYEPWSVSTMSDYSLGKAPV